MSDQIPTFAEIIDLAVDLLLDGSDRQVMVGPVVWNGEPDNRNWYFIYATGKRGRCWSAHINAHDDQALAERSRSALRLSLIQHYPLVVHCFDDELEMARWAAAAWPSPETEKILAGVEAERAAFGASA